MHECEFNERIVVVIGGNASFVGLIKTKDALLLRFAPPGIVEWEEVVVYEVHRMKRKINVNDLMSERCQPNVLCADSVHCLETRS
jgi:hypothetical protein